MSFLRQSQTSKFARLALALAIAAGSLGSNCSGVPVEQSTQPCAANVAQIQMFDGGMRKICGCGGTNGEYVPAGTPLTCTFALGTTFFVSYIGPFLQHQFISSGTPAAPNGPVFDPSAKLPIRAHAFTLTATGTYPFEDEYDHQLSGTIVVTP
jgi:hypothetical protein